MPKLVSVLFNPSEPNGFPNDNLPDVSDLSGNEHRAEPRGKVRSSSSWLSRSFVVYEY